MSVLALPGPVTLASLAARHGGVVASAAEGVVVERLAPVTTAGAGDLAPLLSRRKAYARAAAATEAAVLVDAALADRVPVERRWSHPRAEIALAALLRELAPPPPRDARHEAFIDPEARVHPTASIGPRAVILAGAVIGEGARVEPNAVVYGGAVVGARVLIGAGAVIGRPGFGWTFDASGAAARVPQLGGVILEEDVEVGPLATVDAGTLGPTIVRRGAKLDAHVHVGHNGVVGEGSMVAAQVGFAGSAEVGRGVLIGGQAGVGDHVKIGDGARIGGGAGVIGDIEAGAVVAGYPAVPRARWPRATATLLRAADGPPRRRRSP